MSKVYMFHHKGNKGTKKQILNIQQSLYPSWYLRWKKPVKLKVTLEGKPVANEYLIEIHNYISEKIDHAQNRKDDASANNKLESQRFYEGQLKEWRHLRKYLAEKVDLKTQKYF